jgi:hypothetical protein
MIDKPDTDDKQRSYSCVLIMPHYHRWLKGLSTLALIASKKAISNFQLDVSPESHITIEDIVRQRKFVVLQ